MAGLAFDVRAIAGRPAMVALIAALLSIAVAPAPTLAANLLLAPMSGPPGTNVEATANGFLSGPVTFWWDNTVLLGTDPAGRVRRLMFAVPSSAAPGDHTVRACAGSACPPGPTYADATFTVTGVATPKPTPKTTPKTTPKPAPTPTGTPTAPASAAPVATPGGPSPTTSSPPSPNPTEGAAGPLGPTVSASPLALPPPSEPGTVKIEWPWLALGLAFAAAVVILLVTRRSADGSWLRVSIPGQSGPVLHKGLSTGTHDPPKPKAPQGQPPELPVMASLTEGTAPQPGIWRTHLDAPPGIEPTSDPTSPQVTDPDPGAGTAGSGAADADVTMKGSKIKEN